MNILAIIPARGGSKSIPGKNLVDVAGKPLIAWTIEQALAAKQVNEVIVSSDDQEILDVAFAYRAQIVTRPTEIAGDESTSEDTLLHVLDEQGVDPDLVVFLQCTSPIRRPVDIDLAIHALLACEADSVFSAVETQRVFWTRADGCAGPVNRSLHMRRPRQLEQPWLMENGSIYVFPPRTLRKYHSRFGKDVLPFIMDYWSQFEIDEPEDLELVRMIMERQPAHV